MDKPTFVHVTYISTTADKVWQALTDREMTRKYWYHENVSDWKPGSSWEHQRSDETGTVDVVGKVVESVPPRRLVVTWAMRADAADSTKHSRVTFDIEPLGEVVRLTVTHEELELGSEMLQNISEGWPIVVSGMKSLLETGRALPKWW